MKPLLTHTNHLCKFHQILQRQSTVVKRKFDIHTHTHTEKSLFLFLFIFTICEGNNALCLQGQHKEDEKNFLLY